VVTQLAVTEMPGSDSTEELLDSAGIGAAGVAPAARAMLARYE
jgi:hypothetical protein